MPRPSKFGININDSGIYMIKNLINGKVYIGSAKKLITRLSHHRYDLNNNKHHSQHLQHAWNKYGENVFIFGVIKIVKSVYILTETEQEYIDKYKSSNRMFGYNICPLAKNNLGSKHQKGIEDKKRRMSGVGNNFYGRKHTLESLSKISKSNFQKKITIENINEIRFLSNYGIKQEIIAKVFNVGQPHISKIINNRKRTKNYDSAETKKT